MGLFSKKSDKENKEQASSNTEARRPSVRELQARALDTWSSPTYSRKSGEEQRHHHQSGFEAERAARRASHVEQNEEPVVMRT